MKSLNYYGKPILICGPTASGKSALGLAIAERIDGCIINADALQVYDTWRVLTARPSVEDEIRAPHFLYGHVPIKETYSVGGWLRDLENTLKQNKRRPVIIGGTGLYFSSLTKGLAAIPETPEEIRERGNMIRNRSNTEEFIAYLSEKDPETLAGVDVNNAMRLQRAWEVLETTGRGLASWQSDTSDPLLNLGETTPIVLNSNPEWLNRRIGKRFDAMVDQGALDECHDVLAKGWDATLPSSRALGAQELISYLAGDLTLEQAKERATIATRQFAKRQRTWFRSKMKDWTQIALDDATNVDQLADFVVSNGNPT